MDLKVLEVQKWLNLTYGNHPDFPAVTEDGLTGNSTIKALIRGLQIEAGVKVDGVLGVFCQALFPKKSVRIPCFQQGIFPALGRTVYAS